MKKIYMFFAFLMSFNCFAQSDVEKVLKGGEILVNGLSFFKGNKSADNSKVVESVCIKNKLSDKITFTLIGKDSEGNAIKKELVIQKDSKECVFELPKGIYIAKIKSSRNTVAKKIIKS